MAIRRNTFWDLCRRGMLLVNYEIHLVQLGLERFADANPWLGLPLVACALPLAWSVYWVAYAVVVLATIMAMLIYPLEVVVRKRA